MHRAFLAGIVVGALSASWWWTRPNPQHERLIARADSALALREADSLEIAALLERLDAAARAAAGATGEGVGHQARGRAIAAAPVRPPAPTLADSARFWRDSAGKAQRAYATADSAATLFHRAVHEASVALAAADSAIRALRDDKASLLTQVDSLSRALRRARPTPALTPIVGVGYGLSGGLDAFVGAGGDPIRLTKRLVDLIL